MYQAFLLMLFEKRTSTKVIFVSSILSCNVWSNTIRIYIHKFQLILLGTLCIYTNTSVLHSIPCSNVGKSNIFYKYLLLFTLTFKFFSLSHYHFFALATFFYVSIPSKINFQQTIFFVLINLKTKLNLSYCFSSLKYSA